MSLKQEGRQYTDMELSPFRRMGDIRLLYTAQSAEDTYRLMNNVTNVGLGISLATEVVNSVMKIRGKNPNQALVNIGRLVSFGLAVGGFIGEKYFDAQADKAANVIAERADDQRSLIAIDLVSLADRLDPNNPLREKVLQLWGDK